MKSKSKPKTTRLAKERERLGFNKRQLAELAHLDQARLGQIENGRYIPPEDSTVLQRLAAVLREHGYRGSPADLIKPW